MPLADSVNSGRILPHGVAYTRTFFVGVTGLALTVTLSKAGGAFAAAAGVVAEIANGWYKISLTAADTNTLGDLAYHASDGGANVEDWSDQVGPVLAQMADGVLHGGPDAGLYLGGTGTPGAAAVLISNGGVGPGLVIQGSDAPAVECVAGPDLIPDHPAVLFSGTGAGAGLILNSGDGVAGDLQLGGSGLITPMLSTIMADGVAHGGSPGSSTATLALARVYVSSPDQSALVLVSGLPGAPAVSIDGTHGVHVRSGYLAPGSALYFENASGDSLSPAILIDQTNCGSYLQCFGAELAGLSISQQSGPAVQLASGEGGNDISLSGDGQIWDALNNRPVASVLAPIGADLVVPDPDSGLTLPQLLALIAAATCGEDTGTDTAVSYAAAGGSTVRVTADTSTGRRTGVVLTPP